MISIKVNNNEVQIEEDFTIQQVLEKINSSKDGIAVAVNNAIVMKNQWSTRNLSPDDNLLIIQATQGG